MLRQSVLNGHPKPPRHLRAWRAEPRLRSPFAGEAGRAFCSLTQGPGRGVGRREGTVRVSEGGGSFIEGTVSLEKGSSLGERP